MLYNRREALVLALVDCGSRVAALVLYFQLSVLTPLLQSFDSSL